MARLAFADRDGVWRCGICGLESRAATASVEVVDREVGNHLREAHDRILVSPVRCAPDGRLAYTVYVGRALTDYEILLERNQKLPAPPRRRQAPRWRR
jgi:hypothetical protein